MAYKRTETTDGVTKMSKALYDNLQDGIDELRVELGIDVSSSDTGDGGLGDTKESIRDMLNHQTMLLSDMRFSIESILKGFEEKNLRRFIYEENWKIIKNEKPDGLAGEDIIFEAPEDDFILVFFYIGPFSATTVNIAPVFEGDMVEVENIIFSQGIITSVYGGHQMALYKVSCNKGNEITMKITEFGSTSYNRDLILCAIY